MRIPEQVKAPGYPERESVIALTPTDRISLNEQFRLAVEDGDERTWESYDDSDYEVFMLKRVGPSASQDIDGYCADQWLLRFGARDKVLFFDAGSGLVEHYTHGSARPMTHLDVSDLIAASFNLQFALQ